MPPHRLKALTILAATFILFVCTNQYFTLTEDETRIVVSAQQPVAETLRTFTRSHGQHEHPPLSDILLHYWLPVAGSSLWLLRLPSIVFYLAGVLVLAACAARLAGPQAFLPALFVGCLWPCGFSFGRMVGWYPFCFFLTTLATLTYLRYWEAPVWPRFLAFISTCIALLYSNYFGWAIVACLLLDSFVRMRRRALRFVAVSLVTLVLAYTPLWRAFLSEISYGLSPQRNPSAVGRLLNVAAKIQVLFVGESIAPWYWLPTVVLWGAIVIAFMALARLLRPRERAFLGYFALLFASMAALGILGSKRLLFICPWLILTFAIGISRSAIDRRRHTQLTLCVVLIAGLGWMGTITRKYYAAPDILEPWESVATRSAAFLRGGGSVITNSKAFLFYLSYSLHANQPGAFHPGWVDNPKVADVDDWNRIVAAKPVDILLVTGVTVLSDEEVEATGWLTSNCQSKSVEELLPDTGYDLKRRFFSQFGQRPFRIRIQRFSCI